MSQKKSSIKEVQVQKIEIQIPSKPIGKAVLLEKVEVQKNFNIKKKACRQFCHQINWGYFLDEKVVDMHCEDHIPPMALPPRAIICKRQRNSFFAVSKKKPDFLI